MVMIYYIVFIYNFKSILSAKTHDILHLYHHYNSSDAPPRETILTFYRF